MFISCLNSRKPLTLFVLDYKNSDGVLLWLTFGIDLL